MSESPYGGVRPMSAAMRWRILGCIVFCGVASLPNSAHAVSLQQLFAGSFIDNGNLRFSNWQLHSLDYTAAVGPNLSLIDVTATVDDPRGLRFTANGNLTTQGQNVIDLLFAYQVSVLSGPALVNSNRVQITGLSFSSTGGLAFVSGDTTSGAVSLGSNLAIANNEAQSFTLLDVSNFSPHSSVTVTTNVFVTGTSSLDTVNLSAFTQRFTRAVPGDFDGDGDVDGADFVIWQTNFPTSAAPATSPVPEPAAVLMAICGLAFVGVRARKNKTHTA